jgi:hypothetical protein
MRRPEEDDFNHFFFHFVDGKKLPKILTHASSVLGAARIGFVVLFVCCVCVCVCLCECVCVCLLSRCHALSVCLSVDLCV